MKKENLSFLDIKRVLLNHYDLNLVKLEKVKHSSTDCYIITCSEGKYFMKSSCCARLWGRWNRSSQSLQYIRPCAPCRMWRCPTSLLLCKWCLCSPRSQESRRHFQRSRGLCLYRHWPWQWWTPCCPRSRWMQVQKPFRRYKQPQQHRGKCRLRECRSRGRCSSWCWNLSLLWSMPRGSPCRKR